MLLSVGEIQRRILYDPETGVLSWRADPPRGRRVGDALASRDNGNGYLYTTINRRPYAAHRVAWVLVFGFWPIEEIDHRDTVKLNNTLDNLREASRAQNEWNAPISARNTSGFKGASWHKHRQRWRASIRHNGRHVALGYFDTPEQAHAAYCQKAVELRGEFARAA